MVRLIAPHSLRKLQAVYSFTTTHKAALVAMVAALTAAGPGDLRAAEAENPSAQVTATGTPQDVVIFDAEFFVLYQPNSALEMVQRIPGFRIDDGDDKRGFGAAAGNILINDRYPSAKQDKASSILERIPASQVERIELLRGQVRGVDLRGQSVVASIILRDDIPATTRWESSLRKNFNHSPMTFEGSISLSDTWKGFEYNVGVAYRRFRSQELGPEEIFDVTGAIIESRYEDTFLRGDQSSINLNVLTSIDDTLVNFNTQFAEQQRSETLDAVRTLQAPAGQNNNFFVDDNDWQRLEIGADAERNLAPDFLARAVLLYSRFEDDPATAQVAFDGAGTQTLFRRAAGNVVESEAIARLEFDWAGWANHALQVDIEGARNVIDNELVQVVDFGGGLIEVPVPGANTRVDENRVDVLINDTWFRNDFEIEYGLGAESSTITQSGDAVRDRSFFFLKPQFSIAYSPTSRRQTRLRLAREVSQLDFSDFVSSTVFQDDDLALGNPNLKPETTWVAEVSEERRYGELGVFKVLLFYHWISDVEDLLPLSPEFEAPGNIGDGRRRGIEFEATIPVTVFGLSGARLDVQARLQESEVRDPVTGADRLLSGEGNVRKPLAFRDENRYAANINFRQDLEELKFAWGWEVRKRGNRFAYRVNEFVKYDDGYEFNAFLETTRWLGLKMRLEGLNLLDFRQFRYRTIFAGERDLSAIDVVEVRERTDGRRALLTISGSF